MKYLNNTVVSGWFFDFSAYTTTASSQSAAPALAACLRLQLYKQLYYLQSLWSSTLLISLQQQNVFFGLFIAWNAPLTQKTGFEVSENIPKVYDSFSIPCM